MESATKTLQLNRVGGLFLTFLLTIGLYLLGDSFIRTLDPFGTWNGWDDPELAEKVTNATDVYKKHGRIDLFVLSSSLALQTDVRKWLDASNGQIVPYNAALGGQRPQAARFLFENFYWPATRPTHLIYFLSPRDVNAMGRPASSWKQYGSVWRASNVQRVLAQNPKQKLQGFLEKLSALYQSRKHARALITKGEKVDDYRPMVDEYGNGFPLAKRLPEANLSAEEYKKILPGSPYANFTMPEDGEQEHLLKLAQFCRDRKIKFVIAKFPVPPVAKGDFSNYENDIAAYEQGLSKLSSAGVRIIDMAKDLRLQNPDFYDHSHTNRFGSFKIASYLYSGIIREWFGERARPVEMIPPATIPLWKFVPENSDQLNVIGSSKMFASGATVEPWQIITNNLGAKLDIPVQLPRGTFTFDLFTPEPGNTTASVSSPVVSLLLTQAKGNQQESAHRFTPYLRGIQRVERVQLESTTTMAIQVDRLANSQLALDALIVEPTVGSTVGNFPLQDTINASAIRPVPIIDNPSFELEDYTLKSNPAAWLRYPDPKSAWGRVQWTIGGRSGKYSVKLRREEGQGWGGLIFQRVQPESLTGMRGKTVEVSMYAKSQAAGGVFGALTWTGTKGDVRLPQYTKAGDWQWLSVKAQIPEDAQQMQLLVGAVGKETVTIDDVNITIVP